MGRCRLGAAEETAMGRGLPTGTGEVPRARGQAPPAPWVRGCSPEGPVRAPRWPPPHHAGAWWSRPSAPGPYHPGHPCHLSGGTSWHPGSHSTASNLMAGAHIRGFLGREKWPWGALPREPGWGRNKRRFPPRWGGSGQQSPHKHQLAIEARKPTPTHRPYLAACSVASPAQRSSREEPWTQSQEVRAAAPALRPQGPARQAGKGGWSEPPNGSPAQPPARRNFCQESFFSPAAAAPTPLNLSSETGYFSLGGEGCQVIGPV